VRPAAAHESPIRTKEATAMADDKIENTNKESETATTTPVENMAAYDPGPIHIDAVMKDISPEISNPMMDQDLGLGKSGDDDTNSVKL
jgi:hypothetical protein